MSDASSGDIAQKIRKFATIVDDPDNWVIVTPTTMFDDVKDALDVDTSGIGTDYKGISLCYGAGYDETQVRCRQSLDDYLSTREAESDPSDSDTDA